MANLSRSGAKLFTVRSAPVGSLVELELLREGAEPLSVLATVRRVERPTRSDREASLGMSVEFRDLDPAQDAVLVHWTGDDSQLSGPDGVVDAPMEFVATEAASDHRGKLWEEASTAAEEDAVPPAREPKPAQEAQESSSFTVSGLETSEAASADAGPEDDTSDARVQELEARLLRAESLAAEALVQLARAERKVEQLEAQESGEPVPPTDAARPYGGGQDGTSVLEDPLVAELFSKPVEDLSAGEAAPHSRVREEPDQLPATQDPRDGSTSGTPAIEMIERVGASERRRVRVDEDAASSVTDGLVSESSVEPGPTSSVADSGPSEHTEVEASAPDSGSPSSGGPISGAVAAFHRLAKDPLETVGFSRAELLGDLAETQTGATAESGTGNASSSDAEALDDDRSVVAEREPSAEASVASDRDETHDVSGESGDQWDRDDSMALRVSEEDVFVEVLGLDEEEAPTQVVPQIAAEDVLDREVSDPEVVLPESDGADAETSAEAAAAEPDFVDLDSGGAWPDLEIEEADEPDGPDEPDEVEPSKSALPEEEVAEIEGTVTPSTSGEAAFSDVVEPIDDASAFDASVLGDSADSNSGASRELQSDAEADPAPVAGHVAAANLPADDEVDTVLSAAMVEEIEPAGAAEQVGSDASSEVSSIEVANGRAGVGEQAGAREAELDDRVLTVSDLPTSSEMVEAMGSGRIVRTPRFDRLEPVSRIDIEISDLLRSTDRLDSLEARTRGRVAPVALHRVLFVFFERGLIAVDPED